MMERRRLNIETQPFIILCDINMPVMSGLQLRDAINQDELLRKNDTVAI